MYRDYIKRKEKVLITAIEILNDLGIQGLTTRELAKREDISEPAIYRQYINKQEIIYEILERFAFYDELIFNTVKEQKMRSLDGILYYCESYASYYQNYPQITTVLFSMDVYRYDEKLNEKMMAILKGREVFMTELCEGYLSTCEESISLTAEEMAEAINGTIWAITFKWKIKDHNRNLKELILKQVSWILRLKGDEGRREYVQGSYSG